MPAGGQMKMPIGAREHYPVTERRYRPGPPAAQTRTG
jgi:hypothetical protein